MPVIVLTLLMGIGFGVYRYNVSFLLLIASLFTGILAMLYGTTWQEINDAISDKVGKAFMPVFIFVFVGMIIGSWMLSGTIPMMVYYGLKLISPAYFLVSAFIICSIVSVCTGTSFGSVGTVGLALIGVASGLGVNMAAAAGAIISGSYFGDKMSPLSDTTNLAPVAAGDTLFEHVGHMFYSTIPISIICLIVYFIAGRSSSVVSNVDLSLASNIMKSLDASFKFNILLLLPILVVLIGSVKGFPPIPVMFLSSLIAGLLAIVFQGSNLSNFIIACSSGFKVTMLVSGDSSSLPANVVTLLERGGMLSMMGTMLMVLCSFTFGGIMTASGFLENIINKLQSVANSDGSLVAVSAVSTAITAVIAGNAYIPILINGELFRNSYIKRHLHPMNLSMVLEDCGTVVVPLVPWSAGGAYMSATLGVATFAYDPWAVLCLLGPIFMILYGYTGFSLKRITDEQKASYEAKWE